jgi:hypothetical protein
MREGQSASSASDIHGGIPSQRQVSRSARKKGWGSRTGIEKDLAYGVHPNTHENRLLRLDRLCSRTRVPLCLILALFKPINDDLEIVEIVLVIDPKMKVREFVACLLPDGLTIERASGDLIGERGRGYVTSNSRSLLTNAMVCVSISIPRAILALFLTLSFFKGFGVCRISAHCAAL